MHKKAKIATIIIIVLVVFITSIDIITKVNYKKLLGLVNPMDLQSNNVPYTKNGQSTVQGAIDDLYNKSKLSNRSNFIEAYSYNQTEGATNYCVTGNESTCERTDCYKDKTEGKCNPGDIIRYKVREGEVVTFHVMYNDASTITMQSQKNIVYNTAWITALDYSGSTTYGNDKGPLTILTALENATTGWNNVNDITYTAGTTAFSASSYTGCIAYNSCGENTYTLSSRTAKTRMITVQEANALGCSGVEKSCPKWMNNYLSQSITNGGTADDKLHSLMSTSNSGYWTMSSVASVFGNAWRIGQTGGVYHNVSVDNVNYGARAVVQVSK